MNYESIISQLLLCNERTPNFPVDCSMREMATALSTFANVHYLHALCNLTHLRVSLPSTCSQSTNCSYRYAGG